MTSADALQILVYVAALVGLAPPLGALLWSVLSGEKLAPGLRRILLPFMWLERGLYRAAGVDPAREMPWSEYAKCLLAFNAIGLAVVFALQVFQSSLPFNPEGLPSVSWHSAFNTAASFVTNANWQGYAGESTMSYLTQAAGLATQNFLSAATGIAAFLALARALSARPERTIGNFWSDLVKSTVFVLLPFSLLLAIFLVSQGVVQSLAGYVSVETMEGAKQVLPLGPAASQIAIKQLGTNGGGFFNANGTHPFENPTPLSNAAQALAILLIPAALPFAFGKAAGRPRHAWIIFGVMLTFWLASLVGSLASELSFNPVLGAAAPMEGKEVRVGAVSSIVWSTATTAASNGSVNAMHSSLSPLAGGIAMFNMMLGEVIFGGVGAGMYGMLLFILLAVFLAGLMVGRSPEYLGKKLEAAEIKMAILGVLGPCALILIGSAISARSPNALASLAHKGPHGLSEILYAWTSATANNGSAFAGLNANVPWWNLALAFAMLAGRFVVLVPALAVAGLMAGKKVSPETQGTFRTDDAVFGILLAGVILLVGALTFVPALALGPVLEHFLMAAGRST